MRVSRIILLGLVVLLTATVVGIGPIVATGSAQALPDAISDSPEALGVVEAEPTPAKTPERRDVEAAAAPEATVAAATTVPARVDNAFAHGSLPFTGIADHRFTITFLVGLLMTCAGILAWSSVPARVPRRAR